MTKQANVGAARVWALIVAGLVFIMVLVGGATRLTESGLSITQWNPISGVLPPLNAADWAAEFEGYKKIPQFAMMNADMTLEGFKSIFWWEWAHRFLARLVGVVFILPALWFWFCGQLKGAFGRRIVWATGFLALEPIVGWWMVSSGLSERTEVAQERLAIHLLIAAAVFAALIHAVVGAGEPRREGHSRGVVATAWAFAALVFVQLGLGALVAGLRAGRIYNDWPTMGGQFMPSEVFRGGLLSLVDDAATSQFDHREIAYLVLLFAVVLAFTAAVGTSLAKRARILAVVAFVQVVLGVATLVTVVQLHAALTHQAVALVLFGLAVAHASATGRESAAR